MNKKIKIENFIERLKNFDFEKGTKFKFLDKIYLYNYPNLVGIYEVGKPTKPEYSIFAQFGITNLHCGVEIIEEDKTIESINAYKLLESPYLADLLNQQRYDEFMEHLKQSELEIVDKISKVIDEINKLKEN